MKNEKNLKEQKSLIHEKNYKMVRKNKSKIFNLIFVIYLKVLKSPNTNLSVLSSVLNGIAHFISHINCFIYIQIIGLINTHLKQEVNNFELDNNTFYEILYQTIYDICAGCENDAEFDSNFNLLTQAVQQLIIRKPREVGTKRSTAFTKRLMNMALFTKSIYVTKIYDLVSEIYQKHPQLSRILDSQSNVGTTFLDTVEHPEYCCPDGIVLWEYHLFQNHFDTGFRKPLFQKFT
ncbi:Nucleolar complex protein 3 [Thelohanellus kitauei]|uniref:Nucleolar complex protein 3 n=1 Tax=Thelohanellus kitauei TaxID=669202 RepID=A0A0C2JIC5_THEKT|nr:Nucleolar complex protein 3 [Thelohanellus kitauei]